MVNICILGASGLLGSSLAPYLRLQGYRVTGLSRNVGSGEIALDTGNFTQFKQFFIKNQVDIVINLIAETNVDKCEMYPEVAECANIKPLQNLIKVMSGLKRKPHLIHISTDHVYSGDGPHMESKVNPINEYSKTKLKAEVVALGGHATILRTNFFGKSKASKRESFTDWIVRSALSRENIVVFDDVYISALHIDVLCQAIERVIQKRVPGVYNLGSMDGKSKAAIAYKLMEIAGLEGSTIKRGLMSEANNAVVRPFDMRMNSQLFCEIFDFQLPLIDSQIELAAEEYLNE